MVGTTDTIRYSQIKKLQASGLSVCEITAQAMSAIKLRGGKDGINCIAELDPTAMEQARELDEKGSDESMTLYGIPVLVKDNIDVKGLHTTAGSCALSDNLAETDAPVIRNLRKNGAVILGKSNMTEFANYTTEGMPAGYSSRGGQVIHAIDPALDPSGSSTGSGTAVCAGLVPAAVGTDTSFSITACAQANGICGIKPPVGVLSADGIIPIARTLDSAGAMAASFRDALVLYSAMRDKPLTEISPTRTKNLKIAINTANQDMVSDGQMLLLRELIGKLKENGASVIEISQPYTPHLKTIMQWEFKTHLEDYLRTSSASRKTLGEIVKYYEENPETMMKYGDTHLRAALDETPGGLQGKPYLEAMDHRLKTSEVIRRELEPFDAVIMTGPTNIMHFCGFPSAAVAAGRKNDSGVNRGFILYGADEMRLYSAALTIEEIAAKII